MRIIRFLIVEELKNRLFLIIAILSLLIFFSYAFLSSNSYKEIIEYTTKATEESSLDWKDVEKHSIKELEEKKDFLDKESDKILLENQVQVMKYRLENNIQPKTDFNTVKGFIEYNYFSNKNILYITTIIILFASIMINFDKSSFYYMNAIGYKEIFFSKIISGILFAIIIWTLNFLVVYLVGIKEFGNFTGNDINFINEKIVISNWYKNILISYIFSLTYPLFSAIIPMFISSISRNKIITGIVAIIIYIIIEPLRQGYIYPLLISKISFIGNMYLLKPVNGVPDIYMNSTGVSILINIIWIIIFIAISYYSFKKFVTKNYSIKKEAPNY